MSEYIHTIDGIRYKLKFLNEDKFKDNKDRHLTYHQKYKLVMYDESMKLNKNEMFHILRDDAFKLYDFVLDLSLIHETGSTVITYITKRVHDIRVKINIKDIDELLDIYIILNTTNNTNEPILVTSNDLEVIGDDGTIVEFIQPNVPICMLEPNQSIDYRFKITRDYKEIISSINSIFFLNPDDTSILNVVSYPYTYIELLKLREQLDS